MNDAIKENKEENLRETLEKRQRAKFAGNHEMSISGKKIYKHYYCHLR